MTRRALIVDDERLARERLRDLLAELGSLEVAGECESGEDAIAATAVLDPDVLFLDVQMPGIGGFDVLSALDDTIEPGAMPLVIFVTAYDQYAIRAFEACALDYLQKPFSRGRLAQAVARAVQQLDLRDAARAADTTIATTEPSDAPGYAARFAVKRGDATLLVRPDEIDWIDAAGNYVRLHVRGVTYMLRSTIGDCESRLDPRQFVRVHRSAIVNFDRVTKIEPFTHGEYVIVASDGTRLRSSRAHSGRLRELLRTGMG